MSEVSSQKSKRRRKGKKTKRDCGEHDKLVAQLRARYGKSSNAENEVTLAHIDADTLEIVHPSAYERQIARATDSNLNRLLQVAQLLNEESKRPENFVAGAYLCAFCQHAPCYGELGELFGPYYVPLANLKSHVPKAILASPTKAKAAADRFRAGDEVNETPPEIDLWFHGDCALWAPALILLGGQFPGLGPSITQYWKQKCNICHKVGATISTNFAAAHPEFFHYPCASDKGYRLNESLLKCEPPLPPKRHSLTSWLL